MFRKTCRSSIITNYAHPTKEPFKKKF